MKRSVKSLSIVILAAFIVSNLFFEPNRGTVRAGALEKPAAIEITSTGFFWPTGKEYTKSNFLAEGCSWSTKKTYLTGTYHIGTDMLGKEKDPVYAIADGTVVNVSKNNWGLGNIGLVIVHELQDKSSFVAVYGHITSALAKDMDVKAGQIIGEMGQYFDGNGKHAEHLHFATRPGTSIDGPYGVMTCPPAGPITDTNGFVDPIKWITTKKPYNNGTLPITKYTSTPTRIIPVPGATPIPATRLDRKNLATVMKWITYLILNKQASLIAPLVGPQGADLFPDSVDIPRDWKFKDAAAMTAIIEKGLRGAGPTCIGFNAKYGAYPDKAIIYFEGVNIDWGSIGERGASGVTGFQFWRMNDEWQLRVLTPTPDYDLPDLEGFLTPCHDVKRFKPDTINLPPSACMDESDFVADVTIPDGTQVSAGRQFTKTWRLKNSGTCAWDSGYELRLISGDPMGSSGTVAITRSVPAGAEVELSVTLTAPARKGKYRGQWQLYSPGGFPFGTKPYVLITVP